ncbi:MAG: hypothetical protein ACI9R8_001930, partial [Candidatus Paceibacteria bacterium]
MSYSGITWKLWVLSLLLSALPVTAEVNLTPEVTRLHKAFDAQWQQEMQSNPTWASYLGDRRYNREWADLSTAGREQQRQSNLAALDNVSAIDRELLDS